MELGLYTFAELHARSEDGRDGHARAADADLLEEIAARRPARASTSSAWASTTARTSPSRRPPWCSRAAAARTKRHPADERGHRAQLRRSRARLPGVRHARPLVRTGAPRSWPAAARSSSRSRCSATTSTTTTSCSPRSSSCCWSCATTSASRGRAGHRAPLDDLPRLPAARAGPPAGLDRRRRHAASVVRAGILGLPMALAIIGGMPERFAPMAELHRRAAEEAGHVACRCSASTPTASSPTRWRGGRRLVRLLRGDDGPDRPRARLAADDAASSTTPRPSCAARTSSARPQQVIEKILYQHEIFGHDRFMLQLRWARCRTTR